MSDMKNICLTTWLSSCWNMKFIKMMTQTALLISASYLLNFLNPSWSPLSCHSKNKAADQKRSHDNSQKIELLVNLFKKWSSFNQHLFFISDLDLISSIANTTSLSSVNFSYLISILSHLSLILLHSHSIHSCASCILLSLRTVTFFSKETFVTDMMPWRHSI